MGLFFRQPFHFLHVEISGNFTGEHEEVVGQSIHVFYDLFVYLGFFRQIEDPPFRPTAYCPCDVTE